MDEAGHHKVPLYTLDCLREFLFESLIEPQTFLNFKLNTAIIFVLIEL